MPGVQTLEALSEPLHALDGGDLGAVGLDREHGAAFDRDAVQMYDTGAALAGVATDMGAGQVQGLAQELRQQGARLGLAGFEFSVYRY